MANKLKAVKYCECSALTQQGLNQVSIWTVLNRDIIKEKCSRNSLKTSVRKKFNIWCSITIRRILFPNQKFVFLLFKKWFPQYLLYTVFSYPFCLFICAFWEAFFSLSDRGDSEMNIRWRNTVNIWVYVRFRFSKKPFELFIDRKCLKSAKAVRFYEKNIFIR